MATISRRQYVTLDQVKKYIGNASYSGDLVDILNEAEELIDDYVGAQEKFFRLNIGPRTGQGYFNPPDYSPDDYKPNNEITGRFTEITSDTQFKLETWQQNAYQDGVLSYCEIEITGGTGAGQVATIVDSQQAGYIFIKDKFETAPDLTSVYRIYQLGKFPRIRDGWFNNYESPKKWHKTVPQAVQSAVLAQVQYMVKRGDEFGDPQPMKEKVGDFEKQYFAPSAQGGVSGGLNVLIAPKAQILLRGIKNRAGRIRY